MSSSTSFYLYSTFTSATQLTKVIYRREYKNKCTENKPDKQEQPILKLQYNGNQYTKENK